MALNALEKQLQLANKALDHLIELNESVSDERFGITNKNGKIILKGNALAAARQKQQIARDKMLATWANYQGGNPYLEVVHGRDIGKISHGGAGGFSGKGGGNALGSVLDWTFRQQHFNTNAEGTRYTSGHVKGLMTPKAAIKHLKGNQKTILNLLHKPRLEKSDYKNLPWALIHSGNKDLEKVFGRWDLGGDKDSDMDVGRFPNPLQIGGRGITTPKGGVVNPFVSDKFIDEYYAAKGTTETVRNRGFLGIFPGSSSTITRKPKYNWEKYEVKTDHFSKPINNEENRSNVSNNFTNQSGSLGIGSRWEGNTLYGGGGFVGRDTDVRMSDGGSTALSIARRDWGRYKKGDMLGVMTRSDRKAYNREVLGINT
tara:strand:+ start:91 stop:1206 length:1116 start_codon:yes stop_codon:yes gene_type:complete